MDYATRIAHLHAELGIPADHPQLIALPCCEEAVLLTPLGLDAFGRDQFAEPATAQAWFAMRDAAALEGIVLQIASAFRGVDYQAGLIRRKLAQGQLIDTILTVSAAPGHSEHHTGRALDITTPDSEALEEEFENTEAFAWLLVHAAAFGFRLSYPRDNPHGIIYEPWHWFHVPATAPLTA
ncbi:D-alanyl-D-alanine carboxypeptidase family protein [Chitinimonas sp. BJYL2]|uniref:M15 family metallopeptidase n=1 Tax=Chitinimonas sp. BJYL2 TaxID=2976696 RepID=UPI0022B5BB85|nr:M15 family metallopeptidase [Chitinimonas sp. BJYL2]